MKWSIPERMIEQGRAYVKEGRVLSIKQDNLHKKWYAEVLGQRIYTVILDGTAKEQDQCECAEWLAYGYCKHTVAVELSLKEKGISRLLKQDAPMHTFSSNISVAEMFNQGFAKLEALEKPVQTQSLLVHYLLEVLETNRYYPEQALLGLSLRLGTQENPKKSYIVKDLSAFFQAYQRGEVFIINKRYPFALQPTNFSETDQRLLAQLHQVFQSGQLLTNSGAQVKGKWDRRYLIFPILQGAELLQLLNQAAFRFQLNGQTLTNVTFANEQQPLRFAIEKQGAEQFVFSVTRDFDAFFEHYHWGIIGQQIYVLSAAQQEIYQTLRQLLKRVSPPQVQYAQSELSLLFATVVPLLKQIGQCIVAPEVEALLVIAPQKCVFVLKKKRQLLTLRVDFHYGDIVFSTDEAHTRLPKTDQEVVRQVKQEQAIFQLVQQLGYQPTAEGFEKHLPTGESLYAFFKQEIPLLKKQGEVFLGNKLRELYLDAQAFQPSIAVTEDQSWLSVHFDITGISEAEIDAVLRSLQNKEAFYTLKTGEILPLDTPDFQKTSAVLNQLRKEFKQAQGTFQLPKNQSLMVQQLLSKNQQTTFSETFTKMVQDLTHPFAAKIPLPALQATLRPYQKDGFYWLKTLRRYHLGGILADEMGLGKTLQVIAYLLSEQEEQRLQTALIIAPASLIYNWQAEFTKFAPQMQTTVVTGNRKERVAILKEQPQIFITSYASFRQDQEEYQQLTFDCLILDEAQVVKNSSTKIAQALMKINIPQIFALSGTPIENSLEELWSIFQIIMPGLLPAKTTFRAMKPAEVAKIIQPFVLRRDKKKVLQELPEKIESNLVSVMTEDQKTVYLAYLKQIQEDVKHMDQATFKKNRIGILAGLTRLRQICCDPRLFLDQYTGGSGKLEQAKDLLLAAKENKRRVLLFSQFTSMLTILEKELTDLGLTSFYLHGGVKPQRRLEMAEAFNAGTCDVFLISLKAGGMGLNLTGADTVILYDLWWNPAVEEQAAGRAHRIGQKKVVEIWRLIAEGTIEERMYALQQEKRELFQNVMQGGEEQLSRLTEEDIRDILNLGTTNET